VRGSLCAARRRPCTAAAAGARASRRCSTRSRAATEAPGKPSLSPRRRRHGRCSCSRRRSCRPHSPSRSRSPSASRSTCRAPRSTTCSATSGARRARRCCARCGRRSVRWRRRSSRPRFSARPAARRCEAAGERCGGSSPCSGRSRSGARATGARPAARSAGRSTSGSGSPRAPSTLPPCAQVLYLSADLPYERAADVLRHVAGIGISGRQIQRLLEAESEHIQAAIGPARAEGEEPLRRRFRRAGRDGGTAGAARVLQLRKLKTSGLWEQYWARRFRQEGAVLPEAARRVQGSR